MHNDCNNKFQTDIQKNQMDFSDMNRNANINNNNIMPRYNNNINNNFQNQIFNNGEGNPVQEKKVIIGNFDAYYPANNCNEYNNNNNFNNENLNIPNNNITNSLNEEIIPNMLNNSDNYDTGGKIRKAMGIERPIIEETIQKGNFPEEMIGEIKEICSSYFNSSQESTAKIGIISDKLKEKYKGEWFVLICPKSKEKETEDFDFKFTNMDPKNTLIFLKKNVIFYICKLIE